ncbi:MAG: hypothetical protein ACR2HN_10315 [Tepidiformaceae bacterium]
MTAPRQHPLDIAEIIHDARLGDLRTLREERVGYDQLWESTEGLFRLLDERRVPYVLVGGLAMLEYAPNRNTRDIDLIVAAEDLRRLPELAVVTRDRDFARAGFEGVQVDFLLTANPLFDLVRRRYTQRRTIATGEIDCATPEGLVLLKLFALPSLYRQGQFERVSIYESDVAILIGRHEIVLEAILRAIASEVLPGDVVQIREIAAELQARVARFREQQTGPGPQP